MKQKNPNFAIPTSAFKPILDKSLANAGASPQNLLDSGVDLSDEQAVSEWLRDKWVKQPD
jgi:hypothetical protein